MAACGGLEHIFDKPLPEKPTSLLNSFSPWHQIKSMKPIDDSSFTELFGELNFKENIKENNNNVVCPPSLSSSSSSSSNMHDNASVVEPSYNQRKQYRPQGDSFMSESLSLCTEGLGFESFDDVDDLLKNDEVCKDRWHSQDERRDSVVENDACAHGGDSSKRLKTSRGAGDFPPPISCLGMSGKPWVCFKSYREGGRFILKEIRIPTQEFLHACRENGRLRLQFIQSDDDDDDDDEILDEDSGDDHEDSVLENGGGINEGDLVENKGP